MVSTEVSTLTIEMDPAYASLWKVADKHGHRPILSTIHIDPTGKLVATDGFMLAVVPCRVSGGDVPAGTNIPIQFYKLAMEHGGRTFTIDGSTIRTKIDVGFLEGQLFPGVFPRWEQLVGENVKEDQVHEPDGLAVDVDRVKVLGNAIGAVAPFVLRAGPTRSSPCFIKSADALGIVMPMFVSMDFDADMERIAGLQ